jgi:hypothetical protein
LGAYPVCVRWATYAWISCRVMFESCQSPNRGSRCLFTVNRRCFCVECLYIGTTDASHSDVNAANVRRERAGVLQPAAARSFSERTSDACFFVTSPSAS